MSSQAHNEGMGMTDNTNTEKLYAEGLIGLESAAKDEVPKYLGHEVHSRTIQRWARLGLRTPVGVIKLEHVMLPLPAGRATTRPAVARWFARLEAARRGRPVNDANNDPVRPDDAVVVNDFGNDPGAA